MALAALLVSTKAAAETEPIRIEYDAVAGCPGAREFSAEVFKRTQSARLAAADTQARTFVVQIERRRGRLAGSLRVREGGNETVAREVEGERCSEVALALALATALAIDPNAALNPTDNGASDSSGGPGGSGGNANASNSSPAASAANETKPEASPPPSEKPHADDTTSEPSWSAAESRARWGVALGPTLLVGITPRVSLGASLAAEWIAPSPRSWLSSLGAEATFTRSFSSDTLGARSHFQLVYARPTACSAGLGSRAIALTPCLGAELGAISGWGADIAEARSETRFWAALRLFLRVRFNTPSGVFTDAEAGASLPFTRYEFVFLDPNTEIHSVPALGFAASLKVGTLLGR